MLFKVSDNQFLGAYRKLQQTIFDITETQSLQKLLPSLFLLGKQSYHSSQRTFHVYALWQDYEHRLHQLTVRTTNETHSHLR